MHSIEVAIWGAGAVGTGLANALGVGGCRPMVLTRSEATRAALRETGITRRGLFGEETVRPEFLRVADGEQEIAIEPPDFLLVCTKAFASREIAARLEKIAPKLRDRTRLVLCQNGWGNDEPFASFWPTERLYHARVITGFHLKTAGLVDITAHAAPIAIGHLEDAQLDAIEPLARAIHAGGLPCQVETDIRGTLWAKMLYNCALNPLGALTTRRYGELAEDPAARAIMDRVIEEVFTTLLAAGFHVAWSTADAYREAFYEELIPPTAAHPSSMLQDLQARRPTEIEALCGAVERLAKENGVDVPTVSALATLVRHAERGAGDS